MTTRRLIIGKQLGKAYTPTEEPFEIPWDVIARTLAIIGQRGSGKSSTATVIAEEFCKAALPWIALDPVGIWWGLRARADGSPGGYPVVVFGGERGDLPLEKGHGRKIAEACIAANVFAVIDLSRESKTTWRTIVRDFCHGLQELRPEHPRHIFLEEAPEFIPQRTSYQLGKECKEIVDRLIRLGRNWGYGATILSQRPATVDKDVLSQCENLLVMRTSGAHDRKALREWISANASEAQLDKVLGELASLPDGAAWFWSPQWLKKFLRVQVRRRETFHPGETRTVGAKARAVELVDVEAFVAKVRKELTKTTSGSTSETKVKAHITSKSAEEEVRPVNNTEVLKLKQDLETKGASIVRLEEDLRTERVRSRDAERRLEAVRARMRPEYDALKALFEDLGQGIHNNPAAPDRAPYEQWLEKARKRGCGKMLEILLDKPELTKHQLGILAGVQPTKSTFRAYMAWLKRAGLVEAEGENVRLRMVAL